MEDVKKRSVKPELYVLLTLGIKPQVLIELGYSEATIYKYNRKVKEIRETLNTLLHIEKEVKKEP